MRYTSEQKAYILEIASGRYNDDIAELFNKRFGTSVTATQIRSYKKNHKIKSNLARKRKSKQQGLFTDEQAAFVKENVVGLSCQELTDRVNVAFNLQITVKQMNGYKKNRKLNSGFDSRFKKGNIPVNKGTKGMFNVGGNKTSFVKGSQPQNYLEIGSEVTRADGYVAVKIGHPNVWTLKHRMIWEAENGKIPKDCVLLFADQDKSNVTIENLMLVKRANIAIMNRKNLLQNNREGNQTAVIISDVFRTLAKKERRNE